MRMLWLANGGLRSGLQAVGLVNLQIVEACAHQRMAKLCAMESLRKATRAMLPKRRTGFPETRLGVSATKRPDHTATLPPARRRQRSVVRATAITS